MGDRHAKLAAKKLDSQVRHIDLTFSFQSTMPRLERLHNRAPVAPSLDIPEAVPDPRFLTNERSTMMQRRQRYSWGRVLPIRPVQYESFGTPPDVQILTESL